MSAQKTDIQINLRTKPREPISTIFFKWAVNIGRIVIVGTELILLAALFYRFIVDRQIIDLHEVIQRKLGQVANQADDEKKYRDIQARLAAVKQYTSDTDVKITVFNFLLNATNNPLFAIKELNFTQDRIAIEGEVASIRDLNDLLQKARTQELIESISLDEVTNTENRITFEVSIIIAKGK